ncbi:L-dopachrome tautomerase-related protein [Bosea sp. BK604]|uniref:L-dopachrome tautomerase-related protein n=1 Tax=Bosea sp. BK604 TaxID=2512180 RepID=UPI00104C226D|nr:L-dopachrome tautomerase-related protein [Bosea sp. BK604]TCR61539.1 major royal jelly protein [Bosea sp. BK604]
MTPIRTFLLATAATLVSPVTASEQPKVGQIEIVAELDITPGNVTASKDGRVFASVHGMRRGPVQMIEITGRSSYVAFPDAGWNAKPGSGPNVLNTPHGVLIDTRDWLWVVDHGNWMDNPQPPKLVAFDINTRKQTYRFDFDATSAPKGQILQDLAVDAERGFVYVADCGPDPALVVVNTGTGKARRFSGHASLAAEDVELVVEGKPLLFPGADGRMAPTRVGINPVTLSADGETLFFGSMNGKSWFAAPARLLREGADDAAIGAAIRSVGPKPLSDGAATDAEGNHFITNLPENGIDKLTSDGQLQPFVRDDRFLWPDNAHFGPDSWLYVAVNQLHRNPIFSGTTDAGKPPYLIARIWTGTRGQPGR